MENEIALQIRDVSERYGIDFLINGKVTHEEITAVDKVSFTVKKGECVAMLGANGAGKSTILKLIAGIIKPDAGDVRVEGRVASILDLGAGFDPQLTGRENIFLLAKFYGIAREEIQPKMDQVIAFSGIGKFIDAPLKCYSSGMYVRLAFSLAIHVEPDIILIDDCLAVGDEAFQKKCIEKIFELKNQGKTIIFVTHDAHLVSVLARRGIFVKDGRILHDGPIERAIVCYTQMVGDINGIGILNKDNLSVIFNNGKIYINWRNAPLSKGFGGFAVIRTGQGELFSKDLSWRVELEGMDSLMARATDAEAKVIQAWSLKLAEDNCIDWQIDTAAGAQEKEYFSRINLMLNERFTHWSTLGKEGVFPSQYPSVREWQVLDAQEPDTDGGGIISCRSESPDEAALPGVVLESAKKDDFLVARALITGPEQSARVLSLEAMPATKGNRFSGRIRLFENNQELASYLSFRKAKFIQEHTIQKLGTKLFFDRGRLRLFYKESELTKANCFFGALYAKDRWFSSFDAAWSFKKQDEQTILVSAYWPELKARHAWQVSLVDQFRISWKVVLETEDDLEVLSCRNGIYLSTGYKDWFSSYEEGVFPGEFQWQDMVLENPLRKSVGVKKSGLYPGVALETRESGVNNTVAIQNSDSHYQSRIIYAAAVLPRAVEGFNCPAGRREIFSGVIQLYPSAELVEKYLEVSQKEKLDKELSLQARAIETHTIQKGPIKIIFDAASLRIFYNELEISEGRGIRSVFDVHKINKQLNSDFALWQVDKVSLNRMKCVLRWVDIASISQEWDISIEDNRIDLLLTMTSYDNTDIFNERTGLLLSRNYKQWVTASGEEGEVNYDFSERSKGVALKNNKAGRMHVREFIQQGTVYPAASFSSFLDRQEQVVSLTVDKDNGLGLYFFKVKPREAASKTPGTYVYFKGSVIFKEPEPADKDPEDHLSGHIINLPGLKALDLRFDNGAIKLFWGKKEITKGLGFYTSFCCAGLWHDSSQAIWKKNKICAQSLEVTGTWAWIPVIQSWRIKTEGKKIILDIETEVYREFYLESEEVNLFLTDEYRKWFAGKRRGPFYNEFSQSDLFRFRIWISRVADERMGVEARLFRLPAVSLRPQSIARDAYLVIENANILRDKGRLIQYMRLPDREQALIRPCHYNSFKGVIEVGRI
ncbi:MAG: ABC transporter ATP-binding protein [Candidatus Omnitrophica bacterium]|nr:ABC transporter ATP-binding protein [Candidatus Omnitrophota bacterium]